MSGEGKWVYRGQEYEYTAQGFRALLADIQAGRIGREVYDELLDRCLVPEVDPMTFDLNEMRAEP